ncbi:DedA family protein [Aureimonas sp. AU40]|uniref:DedA family protein n=1 Tax=Aureimonas sp. AU40 TaxID=1637747 RepID=UPI0007832207|nr:DedA family protein [Aureimonas sp. AU40]
MEAVLAPLVASLVTVMSAGGLVGVAVLMGLESACLPLPSEIIMPFAGYLASTGQFSLLAAALAGAIGCNIGSHLAYEIGARGGRPFVERLIRRAHWGTKELALSDRFFARYGSLAIFIGRLLPVVRTFLSLPAGIARMNLWRFHLYTFTGSFLWCYALAWLGARLGEHWNDTPWVKTAFHVADALVILAVIVGAVWFWRSRRRSRA